MSNDADQNSIQNSLLINLEQQFRRMVLETESNELIINTTQEKLNNSLKRIIFLEHELETERLNKSMIKMELDTLTTMMNKNDSTFNVNILINEREYFTNKLYKIQTENMELKQELTQSNSKISLLLANQYKHQEEINSTTLMLNSLQEQLKTLEIESHSLVKILCTSKILTKKILCALEYSKTLNKTQFDHVQYLTKEVANIKSKVHIFIDQDDKLQIVKGNQNDMISSNETHLEIYKKLIEILETENNTLHKNLHQMSKKSTVRDDIVIEKP